MLVQTKHQMTASPVIRTSIAGMGQSWFSQSKAFQAPFSERRSLLLIVDTLLVFLAAYAAFVVTNLTQFDSLSASIAHTPFLDRFTALFFVVWMILALLNDLYDIPSSHDLSLTLRRTLAVGVLGWLIYYISSLFVRVLPSDEVFLIFLGLLLPMIFLWRTAYSVLSQIFLPFQHRVLIIGSGRRGEAIAQVLQDASHLSYQVLGYVDDIAVGPRATVNNLPIVGSPQNIVQLAKEHQAHQIIVATDQSLDLDLFRLLVDCQSAGVLVSWMPDVYEKICHKVPVEHIDPTWGLYAMQDSPIFQRLQLGIKRLVDLLLCFFAWPLLLIVLPLLALLIRYDSPGPIFYRQTRCGRGGKPFSIYKFRTMRVDAEVDGQARWASKADDRITRVGRFLRKSRLDELPQIVNILRGEMSFIGPRPERPEFVTVLEKEIPFYRTRLMVKPGLTGWAQVHYDYGNSVEDAIIKLQYDFYYVRYWSLWLDLYILFRTIGIVVKLKGT